MGSQWTDFLDDARALHRGLPVFVGYFNASDETFMPTGGVQSDLDKLDAAGVRTFVASIGFGCYFQTGPRQYTLAGSGEWLLKEQLRRIDHLLDSIESCPRTRLVRTKKDLDAPDDDSIAVIVHLTGNNHTIDAQTVDVFFEKGVRATHPAMQYHNRWCTGIDGIEGPAMTDFGRQVIVRMNELGILLDTAHASVASARAIIETSVKPVIDSHTTSRDLVPSSRGLPDEVLRMIAGGGGVVGVHFADHTLTEDVWAAKYRRASTAPRLWKWNGHVLDLTDDPADRMRLRKDRGEMEEFFRQQGIPPDASSSQERLATLAHLADMIDYLVNILGIEHVGLGGDVNGIGDDQWPVGMAHIGELPHLTAELMRRGYREQALRKLLAENWLRVYRECLPQ